MDTNPIASSHPLKVKQQPMVYVSYNWADIGFCLSFVEKLRPLAQMPIWVDYEKASGSDDLWDHVAVAIRRATIFIVLVSNAYCDSSINFQELAYAVK
ncbi:unnamed protein product, partial [Adineta steineri]